MRIVSISGFSHVESMKEKGEEKTSPFFNVKDSKNKNCIKRSFQ